MLSKESIDWLTFGNSAGPYSKVNQDANGRPAEYNADTKTWKGSINCHLVRHEHSKVRSHGGTRPTGLQVVRTREKGRQVHSSLRPCKHARNKLSLVSVTGVLDGVAIPVILRVYNGPPTCGCTASLLFAFRAGLAGFVVVGGDTLGCSADQNCCPE